MDEIKLLIKSPVFWFASVFIAFLMSLFSGFVKDWLQNKWATISQKKKKEFEKQKKEIDKKVNLLKNDHQLLAVYHSNIVYQKMRQILYLIVQYVAILFSMSNFINGNLTSALMFMVFSFLLQISLTRSISKNLKEMKFILNESLESEDLFYKE